VSVATGLPAARPEIAAPAATPAMPRITKLVASSALIPEFERPLAREYLPAQVAALRRCPDPDDEDDEDDDAGRDDRRRAGSAGALPIRNENPSRISSRARYRFTDQPTPITFSVKSRGSDGFQYVARIRSQVGGRKSYGTIPPTRPCHVRSASGFDISCEMAATMSPKLTSLAMRRSRRMTFIP
jgi:hypothetical protein